MQTPMLQKSSIQPAVSACRYRCPCCSRCCSSCRRQPSRVRHSTPKQLTAAATAPRCRRGRDLRLSAAGGVAAELLRLWRGLLLLELLLLLVLLPMMVVVMVMVVVVPLLLRRIWGPY